MAAYFQRQGVQGLIIVPLDFGDERMSEAELVGLISAQKALQFVVLACCNGYETAGGIPFVKRIIGVSGDRLTCCTSDGQLTRNGQPLDEPYLAGGRTDQQVFDVTVPAGHFLVVPGLPRPEAAGGGGGALTVAEILRLLRGGPGG